MSEFRNKISVKKFYEGEAKWKRFWKTKREITLTDTILSKLKQINLDILEIGFGDGFLANLLSNRGNNITGIDISYTRAQIASKKVPKANFVIGYAESLTFITNAFDYVICVETLEHIPKYEKTIREVYAVLKPGGIFLITVPYKDLKIEIKCPYCLKKFHPYGHINFFDRNKLNSVLENNDFEVLNSSIFGSRIVYNKVSCAFSYGKKLRRFFDVLVNRFYKKSSKYILVIAQKK